MTESADHRTFYRDPEDAKLIRERFAEDFDFFGYPDHL
jgi:hypothetical protein